MNLQLTYCLDKTATDRVYLLILIPDQKIFQLEWREEYARAISALFQTPVVLVGRTPAKDWQLYGEPDLLAKARGLQPELVPWQTGQWAILEGA